MSLSVVTDVPLHVVEDVGTEHGPAVVRPPGYDPQLLQTTTHLGEDVEPVATASHLAPRGSHEPLKGFAAQCGTPSRAVKALPTGGRGRP